MVHVQNHNRAAILSLAAAGVLWGLSVPLSKLSLGWLTPGWLTVTRFAAAAPLLAIASRRGVRDALPFGGLTEGTPHAPAHVGSILAVAALSAAGSLAFPLFAYGQARVPAELAGAFVNLEPVVGVAAGWIAFGETAGVGQLVGAA